MSWQIYYMNGTIFSDEDGPPEQAPINDVQVICEKRDGRLLQHSLADFYRWTPGEGWGGRSDWSLGDLVGSMMSDKEFKELRGEAVQWLCQ